MTATKEHSITVSDEEAARDYWSTISISELRKMRRGWAEVILEAIGKLEPGKAILLPATPGRNGEHGGLKSAFDRMKQRKEIPDDMRMVVVKGKIYLYQGEAI